VSLGSARRSWVKASRPPAEAPTPTTGTRGDDDSPSCPESRLPLWAGSDAGVDAGVVLLRLTGRGVAISTSARGAFCWRWARRSACKPVHSWGMMGGSNELKDTYLYW